MLHCGIDLTRLTFEQLSCGTCSKCQARSKLDYPFTRDLTTSQALVDALKEHIEAQTPYVCVDPEINKNPDIRVLHVANDNRLICRVEAKLLEGFAFMKVQNILGCSLQPKETLVVDKKKLLSYFDCKDQDRERHGRNVPIFVVWKFNRPCADVGGITVFQEIDQLKEIYDACGATRSFERKTTKSDIVVGQKMGITAKYHFSLKECRPIEDLIPEIMKIE